MALYEYTGASPDNKTRAFCRSHYGQRRTLSAWYAIQAAAGLPKKTTQPGGNHCRHYLTLVEATRMSETTDRMHFRSALTIEPTPTDSPLRIRGVFTTNDLDTYDTRIVVLPSAWERAIPKFLQSSAIAVLEHKPTPVGIVLEMTYEPKDDLAIDLQQSDRIQPTQATCLIEITNAEVRSQIEKGELRGMSWGFIPHTVTIKTATHEMIVHEVRILEITLTAVPSNEDAHFVIERTRGKQMSKINDALRRMMRSDVVDAGGTDASMTSDELLSLIADSKAAEQVQALLTENAELKAQLASLQATSEEAVLETRNQSDVMDLLRSRTIAEGEREAVVMGLRLAGTNEEKRTQYLDLYKRRSQTVQADRGQEGIYRQHSRTQAPPDESGIPKNYTEFMRMQSHEQDRAIRSYMKLNNGQSYGTAYQGLVRSLKGDA